MNYQFLEEKTARMNQQARAMLRKWNCICDLLELKQKFDSIDDPKEREETVWDVPEAIQRKTNELIVMQVEFMIEYAELGQLTNSLQKAEA